MSFEIINIQEAKDLIGQNKVVVVDIRDSNSFEDAHIQNAVNLTNENMQSFLDSADKKKPVICCCYHGISSQNAAQYIKEQGFDLVYSLEGGFEAWREVYPCEGS